MTEDIVQYREPEHRFAEQWGRLVTTWKNMTDLKTAGAIREKLGISDKDFILASQDPELPSPWLEKTANELQIDVTWILTGKAETKPNINQGATGTKVN